MQQLGRIFTCTLLCVLLPAFRQHMAQTLLGLRNALQRQAGEGLIQCAGSLQPFHSVASANRAPLACKRSEWQRRSLRVHFRCLTWG